MQNFVYVYSHVGSWHRRHILYRNCRPVMEQPSGCPLLTLEVIKIFRKFKWTVQTDAHGSKLYYRTRSCKPLPCLLTQYPLSHPLSKIKECVVEPPPSCKPTPTTFAHFPAKPTRVSYTSEYGTCTRTLQVVCMYMYTCTVMDKRHIGVGFDWVTWRLMLQGRLVSWWI